MEESLRERLNSFFYNMLIEMCSVLLADTILTWTHMGKGLKFFVKLTLTTKSTCLQGALVDRNTFPYGEVQRKHSTLSSRIFHKRVKTQAHDQYLSVYNGTTNKDFQIGMEKVSILTLACVLWTIFSKFHK